MQRVYLNGTIEQFGRVWNTNCSTIIDIFKLIDCQTPGFKKYLIDATENGIEFEIQRGSDIIENPNELLLSLNEEDIIITEVPRGSKTNGTKILAAIVLIVASFYIPFLPGATETTLLEGGGAVASTAGWASTLQTAGYALAANLAIQGITGLLAPGPEVDENSESYLFNGPINNIQQGLPVPILYGELIIGGAPISLTYQSLPFRLNSPGRAVNIAVGDTTVEAITEAAEEAEAQGYTVTTGLQALEDWVLYGQYVENII